MGKVSSTTWIWKGMTLKSDSESNGMKIINTVTKIQENVTVDPEVFNVPADVKIQNR